MKYKFLVKLFLIKIININCSVPDDYIDNGNISIGYEYDIDKFHIFFNTDATLYQYHNGTQNDTQSKEKNENILLNTISAVYTQSFGFYNSNEHKLDTKFHFGIGIKKTYYSSFSDALYFSVNVPYFSFIQKSKFYDIDFFKNNPIDIRLIASKQFRQINLRYGVKIKIKQNKEFNITLILYSARKNNFYITASQGMKGIGLLDLGTVPKLFRLLGGEIFVQGKSYANSKSKTKFEDVILPDNIKDPLKEVVEYMKNPQKYNSMGAKLPKGMLLYGVPGTGKTLVAKALSGEIKDCEFFYVSAASFLQENGIEQLREMFREARTKNSAIIFLDELETLGDRKTAIANELLILLDGFESNNENIFVLGATNNISKIDPAILRSGRFDRKFEVKLPTKEARKEILEIHTKNRKLDENIDLDKIAELTENFSGADLATLINEAAFYAIKNENNAITMEDFEYNILKMRETIDNPHLIEEEIKRKEDLIGMKKMLKEIISETKIFK